MKLPKHLVDEVKAILGPHIFAVAREDALMQAATEVLDARQELARTKLLLEAVRGELRTLAVIQMRQRGAERLVLTRKEFDSIPVDTELEIEAPEPGVRIYQLKRKELILNG